jgi:hypothetical protein
MRSLDECDKAVQEAAAAGVYEAASAVQKTAQELSPFLHGDLEASAQTQLVRSTPDRPVAIVSFGGTAAKYALRRHEEACNDGPGTLNKPAVEGIRPGRKYLENALKLRTKQIMEHIARKVGEALASHR